MVGDGWLRVVQRSDRHENPPGQSLPLLERPKDIDHRLDYRLKV